MLSLVLSICSAFGPSIADEAPRTWANFYKTAQSAVALQEPDWVTFYRNNWNSYYVLRQGEGTRSSRIQWSPSFVPPTMTWAVPNYYGPGMQPPPYSFPEGFPAFPGYETPATNPPATPKK